LERLQNLRLKFSLYFYFICLKIPLTSGNSMTVTAPNIILRVGDKMNFGDGDDQPIEGTNDDGFSSFTYFYNGRNMMAKINIRDETDKTGKLPYWRGYEGRLTPSRARLLSRQIPPPTP
jgi:hypothetical protein